MLTSKELYKLAVAGISMKEIRKIEVRRADPDRLCLSPRDVHFLTGCGILVEPQDVLFKERVKKKT